MTAIEIISALQKRGVELNPPADSKELSALSSLVGGTIDRLLVEIYTCFNGFQLHDNRSQISFWPIERVLEKASLSTDLDGTLYYAVGDVMIDSDFIMAPLTSRAPIVLLYEGRQFASSLEDFFVSLTSGQFDFL